MAIVLKVIVLISIFSINVLAKDSSMESKVNHLNKISKNTFDVSLNALNFLLDASTDLYTPLFVLEKTGKIKLIYELESAGYIETSKKSGLPDGTMQEKMFLNIIPVGKGIKIKNAMLSLINKGTKTEDVLQEEIKQLLKTLDRKLALETKRLELIETKELEKLDLNKDGIQDIFYEDKEDFYYALTDRNFDGEVDEKWLYNHDDVVLSGKADNDFDGVFETKYVIQAGLISKELVDSNQNGLYDIYHKYEFAVLTYSEKYYGYSSTRKFSRIGIVKYNLDEISSDEEFIETKISESEFQKERLK